ncbi:hypothetical protein V8B97DRAFT_378434 [Scleroderma yunnanense]
MDSAQLEQYYYELVRYIEGNKMCQAAAAMWLVYDCILMFPQEIEYLWKRPWTRSTFLYLGVCIQSWLV